MVSEYQEKLLELIKKYDPEEYEDLMNCPYGGIVEDHLDFLAEKYPTLEEFEKVMQGVARELANGATRD